MKKIDCTYCNGLGEIKVGLDYKICKHCDGKRMVEVKEQELELITFDDNGQGVINFESLEALTNESFVRRVKNNIRKRTVVKNIRNGVTTVSVYLRDDLDMYIILSFDKKDGYIDVSFFNSSDLKLLGLEVVSK